MRSRSLVGKAIGNSNLFNQKPELRTVKLSSRVCSDLSTLLRVCGHFQWLALPWALKLSSDFVQTTILQKYAEKRSIVVLVNIAIRTKAIDVEYSPTKRRRSHGFVEFTLPAKLLLNTQNNSRERLFAHAQN